MGLKEIKKLREDTGVGMMDCKKALEESNGDIEAARVYLRKSGAIKANARGHKAAEEGTLGIYTHTGNRICSVVEVCCETDFVARSDVFKEFAHNLALHIAASAPRWVDRKGVPQEILDTEQDIMSSGLEKKPDDIREKIVSGKMDKFFKESCLMEQVYIKDQNKTIQDLYNDLSMLVKENIIVKRFSRFEVGE